MFSYGRSICWIILPSRVNKDSKILRTSTVLRIYIYIYYSYWSKYVKKVN